MATYAQSTPAITGPAAERVAFMRKVGTLTFGGLAVAAVSAVVSLYTIAVPVLQHLPGIALSLLVLGSFLFSNVVCRKLVYGEQKMVGFLLASAVEGITVSLLLAITVLRFGGDEGFGIIVQAIGLTGATAAGLLAYAWFNKSDFNWLRAALSTIGIPMLVLMAVTAFFPIGGTMGVILCAAFVLISAAGLLYQLNTVVHALDENQTVEGAYEVTMGVLVLLWNILSLLNRARR